jgi:hypothetical protein
MRMNRGNRDCLDRMDDGDNDQGPIDLFHFAFANKKPASMGGSEMQKAARGGLLRKAGRTNAPPRESYMKTAPADQVTTIGRVQESQSWTLRV